jgi:hypothetical protein
MEKNILGAPGSPYHGSPPLIAICPFAAVWDGAGTCKNQKVSPKKNFFEKERLGRTWQPVTWFPTPFVVVHRRWALHGRLGQRWRL